MTAYNVAADLATILDGKHHDGVDYAATVYGERLEVTVTVNGESRRYALDVEED